MTTWPRWTCVWAISSGCALGCAFSCMLGQPTTSRRAWEIYCCEDGAAGSAHSCRSIASSDVAACRITGAPIECRRVPRCSGPPEQCRCCRTNPAGECTIAVRHARVLADPDAPAEPHPDRRSQRPPDGDIWSPF